MRMYQYRNNSLSGLNIYDFLQFQSLRRQNTPMIMSKSLCAKIVLRSKESLD